MGNALQALAAARRAHGSPWAVLVNVVAGSYVLPHSVRRALLRRGGVTLGDQVLISPACRFSTLDVTIGDRSFLNHHVAFDGAGSVVVGSDCMLASNVTLVTTSHEIAASGRSRGGRTVDGQIRIEDGCWIGAGVTVLPGVTIGRGCLIGAGAVVTQDCLPDGVYVGVPARRVRDLAPLDGPRDAAADAGCGGPARHPALGPRPSTPRPPASHSSSPRSAAELPAGTGPNARPPHAPGVTRPRGNPADRRRPPLSCA